MLQNAFDHCIIFVILGQERERTNSWRSFLRTEVTEHFLATTKQETFTFYSKQRYLQHILSHQHKRTITKCCQGFFSNLLNIQVRLSSKSLTLESLDWDCEKQQKKDRTGTKTWQSVEQMEVSTRPAGVDGHSSHLDGDMRTAPAACCWLTQPPVSALEMTEACTDHARLQTRAKGLVPNPKQLPFLTELPPASCVLQLPLYGWVGMGWLCCCGTARTINRHARVVWSHTQISATHYFEI